jgi:hypothetical protein
MHIFEIESIEYDLEFMPKLFSDRKWSVSQNAIITHNHQHNHPHQHKKRHYKPQHPSMYLTPLDYFYKTNSSETSNTIRCLNANSPCSYGPLLIFTQGGILIFILVTIYSFCMARKPKSRKVVEINATPV